MDEIKVLLQSLVDKALCARNEKDEEDEETYYRYCEEFAEKGYALEDIKQWLELYKFEVIGIYEELTKNPVGKDTQRAVFVAKKHGTQ